MKILNQSKMKQTAVEWLQEYIQREINKYNKAPMDLSAIHALIHIKEFACNKAKEIEKQQIKDAYMKWYDGSNDNADEQYYKETFKSE